MIYINCEYLFKNTKNLIKNREKHGLRQLDRQWNEENNFIVLRGQIEIIRSW